MISFRGKRLFDILVSVLGLVLLFPLIGVAMLAISLESNGPPIFAQTRVGRDGKTFRCYKLRSMCIGTNDLPTHLTLVSAVTSVGHFLRRWKLDELPQLFNVILGNMSLVGPRPCLPIQTALILERSKAGVLTILPGITGLAQIQGIDMSDPVRLTAVDAEYLRHNSFIVDLRILLATVAGSGTGLDHVMSGRDSTLAPLVDQSVLDQSIFVESRHCADRARRTGQSTY
jgi:O-antigen biosynthesis protein WbqP